MVKFWKLFVIKYWWYTIVYGMSSELSKYVFDNLKITTGTFLDLLSLYKGKTHFIIKSIAFSLRSKYKICDVKILGYTFLCGNVGLV